MNWPHCRQFEFSNQLSSGLFIPLVSKRFLAMENRFEKYLMYEKENGIINVKPDSLKLADEAFLLFKSLYDINYGSIDEDENLISIHTGGWSDNEQLISEFKETGWWFMNHEITAKGGHYYFNTDFYADKEWQIVVG